MVEFLGSLGLPDVAVLAPEAPGRTWWPASFLAPHAAIGPHAAAGVAAAMDAVRTLEAAGLARGDIWLLGFSQGACLALESFAREGEALAGVFAFSGGLVGTGDAGGDALPALYGHPEKRFSYEGRRNGHVRLSCHAEDPHIPLTRVRTSAVALRALGAEVDLRIHEGAGHSILPEDVRALRARLNT
jgi:predicted esterase